MKRMIVAAVLAAPLAAAAEVENYVVDPYHTVPYFEVDHLQTATMRGRSLNQNESGACRLIRTGWPNPITS